MKKLLIILFAFASLPANSQIKQAIINQDSLKCCRTIQGKTREKEMLNVPIIYTAQLVVDSISGYPNFNWAVISSTDGKTWNPINSGSKQIASITWEDSSWDTIFSETTPFSTLYLGIEIETVDSVQVAKHKHDLIITPYNLFFVPQQLPY